MVYEYPYNMNVQELLNKEGVTSFFSETDNGSLEIGNESFKINIPNGYGDGRFRVVLVESEDESFNIDANFFTSIEGEFTIESLMEESTFKDIKVELNGTYFIYNYSPDQHNVNIIFDKRN